MAIEPEDQEGKEHELRRALHDIILGYSEMTVTPSETSVMHDPNRASFKCFAKHFNFFDQVKLDEKYQEHFNKAKGKGVPTRKKMLEQLKESGDWGDEDEREYNNKELQLKSLNTTKTKLIIPSQIASIDSDIVTINGQLEKLRAKRRGLLGTTCEDYATGQLNAYTILFSLYEDKELTTKLFSKDDREYLDNTDLGILVQSYNEGVKPLNIKNIKLLSLSGFFVSYYALVEDSPFVFFRKKNIYDLTFYQLNLLSYAKVLRAIIRNTSPPAHIMDSPEKLIEWSEKGEKAKKVIEKARGDNNYSVVGAKREDYEEMGVTRKGDNIFDVQKKLDKERPDKGGDMDIWDFID